MRFTHFADQCPEVARRFWVGVVRGCGFNLGRVGSCWENLRTFFCETRSGYRFFQTKCCAPKLAKHACMHAEICNAGNACTVPSPLPCPPTTPHPSHICRPNRSDPLQLFTRTPRRRPNTNTSKCVFLRISSHHTILYAWSYTLAVCHDHIIMCIYCHEICCWSMTTCIYMSSKWQKACVYVSCATRCSFPG